ncbi:phosphoribosylformylglycinamidine synthase subunit PurS [Bacillus horti]|uniref:Phosphoribosylformylglycinamidine synthase subunit PurS n=1 Tax=Caldalkalibacillus horti TaxID=77523 RepID=A0ABT9W1T4_9BACI|nr:phosphoribosylformylglycinamidine synthase subunit PurS [Bacillus horti]MDQ0167215.1 phosphoribosylformylglycinamidine synthase [Bacillus horti]
MYKAIIHITLKESVLDPQGSAVKQSLHSLEYGEVQDVRIGKFMELELDEQDEQKAQARVTEMCEKLLANTVIEDYTFKLEKK